MMNRLGRICRHGVIMVWLCMLPAHADPATAPDAEIDVYAGYYSREGNDGDLARASRNSHYIRFFPENRVVRLVIPFPYATTVNPDDIRKVFELAAGKTSGSAYISDTFGVLDERVVAQLDSVRIIEDTRYYDCGLSTPCRIEFNETGMNIVQKGIIKDHVTAYDLVPDPVE